MLFFFLTFVDRVSICKAILIFFFFVIAPDRCPRLPNQRKKKCLFVFDSPSAAWSAFSQRDALYVHSANDQLCGSLDFSPVRWILRRDRTYHQNQTHTVSYYHFIVSLLSCYYVGVLLLLYRCGYTLVCLL